MTLTELGKLIHRVKGEFLYEQIEKTDSKVKIETGFELSLNLDET